VPAFIPSDYGNIGDFYIDVATGDFYGPKTTDGWPDEPFFTALTQLNVDLLTNNERYIHTQASPSTNWVITHPLGGHPSVTVVDSAGTSVFGEVKYDSTTQVTVSFTVPFSGLAYLT
jgi:hypothetical protein